MRWLSRHKHCHISLGAWVLSSEHTWKTPLHKAALWLPHKPNNKEFLKIVLKSRRIFFYTEVNSTWFLNFYLLFLVIYVGLWVGRCIWVLCPQMPGDCVRTSGAELKGYCQMPNVNIRLVLNLWTMYTAPNAK